MTDFIPCRKCVQKEGSVVPSGYYYDGGVIKECHHHTIWRLTKKAEREYLKGNFDIEFFGHTLEDYKGTKSIKNIERLKSYVSNFELAQKSFLYFYGDNGTQKTSTASTIASLVIKAGYSAKYILMKKLIDLLWESQQNDEAKVKVKEYLDCDLLVLDEAFSKDKIHIWKSGLQLGYIDEFIRDRVNKGKGILFISNCPIDEIEAQGFSHSIQDLVIRETKKQNAYMVFEDNYFDSITESELPESLF